tara:strand:+ start:56 stop:1291 length:1236 start_codon:yes stop_codon:yes gene_type:complete
MANCKYDTFVRNGEEYDGRLETFLDMFYDDKKFLTTVGLVDVYWCHIKVGKDKYEFDAGFKAERPKLKAAWIATDAATSKKIDFGVGLKGIVKETSIPITKFVKVAEFGGSGAGGKKINKGTEFEKHFYDDALALLNEPNERGSRFTPFIKEFSTMMSKKLGLSLSDMEAHEGLKGVLDEGSKNQSRPLSLSNGGLVVTAGGSATLNMGSTLTDITFQYGEEKKPVYLSLKYGPTLTFFNSGVGGKNGPLLFTKKEIENYKITTAGGLAFLKMFGIDNEENMIKFCDSFVDYPRTKPIPNHKVVVSPDKSKIKKLLKSGMGYGYWMIHNTKATTIDSYEMTESYMNKAADITGDITVHFGRMNGKGKGVNITCSSTKYNFIFNCRNKQGGKFPTHVMCDYKKKGSTPGERA